MERAEHRPPHENIRAQLLVDTIFALHGSGQEAEVPICATRNTDITLPNRFLQQNGMVGEESFIHYIDRVLEVPDEADAVFEGHMGINRLKLIYQLAISRRNPQLYVVREAVADFTQVIAERHVVYVTQGGDLTQFEGFLNYNEAVVKKHPGVQRRI